MVVWQNYIDWPDTHKAPRSMASGSSKGGASPLWWSTPIQTGPIARRPAGRVLALCLVCGVAACTERLFLKEILTFAGHPVTMEVYLDSSAARGVFQRQGVGRIRHLEVKSLWVQEALQRKLFSLHAVPSNDHTADFGTKALTVQRFHKLRAMPKIGTMDGVRYQFNSSTRRQ